MKVKELEGMKLGTENLKDTQYQQRNEDLTTDNNTKCSELVSIIRS